LREAVAIAQQRGELISKDLITRQAQYILICMRESIRGFPTRYARHILGLSDEHQARQILTRTANEFLTELADFPSKITDPNWLKVVETDEEGHPPGKPHGRPSSGQGIKREQERAKRRRAAKTQTMRDLRARKK
jgi:hypothetical protein